MSPSDNRVGQIALSVVIPVYQCAPCLHELHARLRTVLEPLEIDYEIVFVDDRSPDDAWPILKRLAGSDARTTAIRLSRNFGQHRAITAGLMNCRGDHAIVMDCDLQDPPEVIPRLLEEAGKGFDIVYARRTASYDARWRIVANKLYFKLLNWLAGQSYDGEFGSLCIINRKVINSFCSMREPDRHFIMLLWWMGYNWSIVDFERQTRLSGKSSYSMAKLFSHAFSGVVFSTTKLLRMVIYFGFLAASIGIAAAIGIVILRLVSSAALPGWASLVTSQLVGGGLIIICVGVTALYVGKILETTRQRPLFLVDERVELVRRAEGSDSSESAIAPAEPAQTSIDRVDGSSER